jgi:GntR family transcriptional regulator
MAAKPKLRGTTSSKALVAVQHSELQADATRATPRYLLLARTLYNAIQSGAHPIGSLLPTELDLSMQHGVSRQTVRQAIGQLRQQGLVSARKGVGTRIDAKQPPKRFSYSTTSASDLVEVVEGTEMAIRSSNIIAARGKLAAELGCRANHRWLHLACSRRVDGENRLLSWINVYIDSRLAPSLKLPKMMRGALFLLVEKQSGETLVEIQQEIRATTIDADLAKTLDAEEGSAALEITRRYFSTGRRLIMVSVNTMPSDRFFYSVAIVRD